MSGLGTKKDKAAEGQDTETTMEAVDGGGGATEWTQSGSISLEKDRDVRQQH